MSISTQIPQSYYTYPIAEVHNYEAKKFLKKELPEFIHLLIGAGTLAAALVSLYINPAFVAAAITGVLLSLKLRTIPFELKKGSILTGQTKRMELEKGSALMLQYLHLGKKIIKHVQGHILFSYNYLKRTKPLPSEDPASLETQGNAADEILSIIRAQEDISAFQSAELAEKYGVGNCGEMCNSGLKYALEKFGTDFPIEQFRIQGGDHVFLVIGRNQASADRNYKEWGADAVICDPWSGSCYPAALLKDHLKDYRGAAYLRSGEYPEVAPFDPKIQSVGIRSNPKQEILKGLEDQSLKTAHSFC